MSDLYDTKKVHWLNLRYTEQQCPGMRDILASAPHDQQSALVRGILYQWCLVHKQQGTLEQAITTALNGPGVKGQRNLRRSPKERTGIAATSQQKSPSQMQEPTAAFAPVRLSDTTAVPGSPPPSPPLQEPDQPVASDTAANALFSMFDD